MQELKANTQVKVVIGPFVDVSDGVTPETGITLGAADEAELLKHDSATVVDLSGATWAAITSMDGYYNLTLTTSHTDTEGMLIVVVQDDSVCLPVRIAFMVLSEAAYDSKYVAKDDGFMDVNIKTIGRADTQETEADNLESACSNYSATRGLSGTALPAAAADAAGGLVISDAGGLDIDNRTLSASAVTNAEIVLVTDFATNYNTTLDMWSINIAAINGDTDHAGYLQDFVELGLISSASVLPVNVYSISDDLTAANNLEAMLDGTGGVALTATFTGNLTGGINTAAGTITTLDGLNTAQDTQHSTTQTYLTNNLGTAGAAATEAGGTGDHLTAIPWNASWDAEVQSEVQDAIEVNHLDHLLAADYDPASKPGTATALLNELVENDGGVSRFTANALEQAPSGGTNPNVLVDTTIASIGSQTSIVLTAGADFDDAYNDQTIVLYDASNNDYPSVRVVSDYTGSTKTVTLDSAPDFTLAASGDGVKIFSTAPGTSAPTAAQVADAVWDEAYGDHTTASTFGKAVGDGVTAWITATGFSTFNAGSDTVTVGTNSDKTGYSISGTITTLDSLDNAQDSQHTFTQSLINQLIPQITLVGSTGNDTTHVHLNGLTYGDDEIIGRMLIVTDGATEDIYTTWVTDWVSSTELATVSPALPFTPSAVDLDTYTLTSITRDTLMAVEVRTEMDSNSTQLTAIVDDTNELQGDWANTGRLDTILDELTTQGDTNETKIDTIDTNVDTLVSRITSTLFSGITSLAEWLGLIAGKQTGNSTARTELRATGAGSGTFDETTDSLQAIVDTGNSAWITATGFSTHSAADVWGAGTRTLTAFAFNVDLNADQSGVTIGTVTTNTDMRGTDNAFLAASAPANFSSLVISGGGAVDSLVQGFLDTAITETSAGYVAAAFEYFYDVATPSKTVNDVGVAGSGLSAEDVWTYGTRVLTANTNLNDPTAAAIADAIWDEAYADHTTAGTFGKAIGDGVTAWVGGGGGGDATEANQDIIISLLSDNTVTPPNYQPTAAGMVIYRGTAHEADNNRAFTFTNATWSAYTISSVSFKFWNSFGDSDVPVFTKAGSAPTSTSLRLELTADETTALAVGVYTYRAEVTLSDGDVAVLLTGGAVVKN